MGQVIGVVGGGILGLAIGYYLLNWIGGPQYNFLQLSLPGMPPATPVAVEPAAEPEQEAPVVAVQAPTLPPEPTPPLANESAVSAEPPVTTESAPRLPADYVGPRNFTVRHLEELNAAILAAKALLICDRCKSTGFVIENGGENDKSSRRRPCDQCGGRTGRPLTPDGYATLCQLAEMVTFAESEPNEAVSIRRRDALRALLLRATSDGRRWTTISQEAQSALATANRATTGVLIAGTVQEVSREGRLHVVKILLPETNELITIASRVGLPAKIGDRLGVLGSIVVQPAEQLIGYKGDLPVLVWSGLAVRLP